MIALKFFIDLLLDNYPIKLKKLQLINFHVLNLNQEALENTSVSENG